MNDGTAEAFSGILRHDTAALPLSAGPAQERKLFTHLTHDKPLALIDNLLKGGFRRSQNIAYMPYCEGCQACVSVRVLVDEFDPGRIHAARRSNRNTDLAAAASPPMPTSEQFSLFRGYIDARHSDGGMADMTVLDYAMMVEDSVINTFLTEYRVKPENPLEQHADNLAARGAWRCATGSRTASRWSTASMSPRSRQRSLGTYMILEHIEYARRLGLPYLYLGYWIEGSRKMNYKMRFQPQEQLGPNGWVRAEPPPPESQGDR